MLFSAILFQLTASWGKRATSRIDRTQFDKDELLQSLGDQFNVDFADYDKWKRKASIRRPLPGKEGMCTNSKF